MSRYGMHFVRPGLLSVAAAIFVTTAAAQVTTATLSGVVKDPAGALIPNASITATQTETNAVKHVVSDASGVFSMPQLAVGPYSLHVEAPGFGGYDQTGIVLTVGEVANLNVSLAIGTATETVRVDTTPALINTTEPTLQNTVSEQTVEGLPLNGNGRNPAQLVFSSPGVSNAGQNIGTGQQALTSTVVPSYTIQGSIAPAVNGVRSGGTYFSLDGATNVDPAAFLGGPFPDPDATQEFQVVTGTYGAQYQSAPGGAVNIVTRSGTNHLHGTVFEFLRNGAINGQNAILQQPDTLKRNQFGATVGGPVLKDRLFFFGSYQGTRIARQDPNRYQVPTAAERNGIFEACPAAIGTCTPDQLVPVPLASLPPIFGPNTQNNVTRNFLNYMESGNPLIPPANDATGSFYNVGVKVHPNDNQFVAKLEYAMGKHRLFARYFYDHLDQGAVAEPTVAPYNIFNTESGLKNYFENGAVGDSWTPANSLVLNTRVSYLNILFQTASPAENSFVNYPAFGAVNYAEPNPPGIGILALGTSVPPQSTGVNKTPRASFDVSEDVVKELGSHELSFGGNYRRSRFTQANPAGQAGVQIYQGVYTGILGGIVGLNFQDPQFADFYLGHPIAFIQSDGFFNSAIGDIFGLYGQDKWRVTPRFTATSGLRLDPYLPYKPERGQIDCFRPGTSSGVFTNAPAGLLYPGDAGCPGGGTDAKYGEIQPRVGLAYQLDDKGRTALHAGYGIYTIQVPLAVVQGFAAFPYVRQIQLTNPFQSISDIWGSNGATNPFLAGFQGFGYQPPHDVAFPTAAPPSVGNLSPGFRPAYVQQYTLSLQQSLSTADSIEIAFAGTKGTRLSQSYDLNQPNPSPTASTADEQSRRPYAALNQITTADDIGYSNYSSGQVTFRHRRGVFDTNSNFTYSRCIDNGSAPGNTGSITTLRDNHDFNRGLCDFDQALQFRTTAVYTTPALLRGNVLERLALGSWIASGNIELDSGQPFSVLDSADNSFTNTGLDRADYRQPAQPLHTSTGQLNFNAFQANAPGTFGNTPRNGFRSRGYYEVDTSLQKSFRFTERYSLLFRAELFNAINHPNYFGPINTLNSSSAETFGTYQFAHDPRQFQFAVKINY